MFGLFQRAFRNVCAEATAMDEEHQPMVYVVADKWAWEDLFHHAIKKRHRELLDYLHEHQKPRYILGRRDVHMPKHLAEWAKAYWRKSGHRWSDRWSRDEPTETEAK